jgi:hypothetical protein
MAVQRNLQSRIKNDGKDSEAIFESVMQKRGFVLFRLRDKRDLHGLNGRSVAAFGQPSDYIVISTDSAVLAEVKSSHEKISFPLSCFTAAQRAAMAHCMAGNVGHLYYVYIHNLHTNQWYLTTAKRIVQTFKDGKKSIRWNDLNPINMD